MPTSLTSKPRLVGDGPPTCSTCTDLVPSPQWCADVNRYYAELGVHWKASRIEIKRAYLARRPTARLTYVTKQLLNDEIRRVYDRQPLGSVFYDRYVDAAVRRASLRFTGGADVPSDTPDREVVDTGTMGAHSASRTTAWPYAFYLWGTDQEDIPRLREWQELLVRTLGQAKEHMQLAVGLAGGTEHPAQVTVVGYRIVAFLRCDEGPTDSLAQRVASQLTQSTHRDEPRSWQQQESSVREPKPQPRPARAAGSSPRRTTSTSRTASRRSSAS